MKHRNNKKNKIPIIVISISIMIIVLCFVFDFLNLPTKMGINVSDINVDFWGILLGNGIVIALFIITFSLFDKRNLEKEKLADYAGAILLLDAYNGCESFIKIIQGVLATKGEKIQPKISDYIYNGPFENDDKIFDALQGGHISKDFFEQYTYIKKQYQVLAYTVTEMKEQQEFVSKILNDIIQQIKEEKEKLQSYKESLK